MATYYVNPTSGNDTTGDGTSGTPWLTVNKANTESTNADIIVIQAGTHTMTSTTIGYFTEARTYRGELTIYNTLATILDCNGSDIAGTDIGADSININLEYLEFKNINTTDLTLISANSTFQIEFDNTNLTFTRCKFDNVALGASGSTNNAGWWGFLFGTSFLTGGYLSGSIVLFDRCEFSRFGNISGATAGTGGIVGLYNSDTADIQFNKCVLDVTDGGHGGGQIPQMFGARDFGNLGNDITITMRNCITYQSSGTMLLARHKAAFGGNIFIVDADYADNIFFGTYTLDADATYTLDDVTTTDPQFVSAANQNYNVRPDITNVINAGVDV